MNGKGEQRQLLFHQPRPIQIIQINHLIYSIIKLQSFIYPETVFFMLKALPRFTFTIQLSVPITKSYNN